jgi:hypothetical protein
VSALKEGAVVCKPSRFMPTFSPLHQTGAHRYIQSKAVFFLGFQAVWYNPAQSGICQPLQQLQSTLTNSKQAGLSGLFTSGSVWVLCGMALLPRRFAWFDSLIG